MKIIGRICIMTLRFPVVYKYIIIKMAKLETHNNNNKNNKRKIIEKLRVPVFTCFFVVSLNFSNIS